MYSEYYLVQKTTHASLKLSSDTIDHYILPITSVFQWLLGLLQLLDILNLTFFPTVNRLTRQEQFELEQSLILPLMILMGIWIILTFAHHRRKYSLMPLVSILLYPFYGIEATLSAASLITLIITVLVFKEYERYLYWTFNTLIGINTLSLLHWMLLVPLNLKTGLEHVARLNLDIYYIALNVAPLVILPLLFSWLIKLILRWGWSPKPRTINPHHQRLNKKYTTILLTSAIILSTAATFYPYLSSINPKGLDIGVDIRHYVEWAKIVEHDISQAFNVSGGSRPLIHILILSFKRITGLSTQNAVRYLPAILNPMLVLSVYLLTHEIYRNPAKAAWASFFTACGYQITVNMYSYFLANILGLALIFLSLTFLFRTTRKESKNSLVAASITGSLLVFTHPWTFDQYYATIIVTTAVSYIFYRKAGKETISLKPMVTYIAILGLSELIKSQLFRGVGGIAAGSDAINRLASFGEFWFTSIYNFRLLYGGFMSSILLLSLATIGLYIIEGNKNIPERFFTILTVLTSLVFLIGDETIKSRLLFNLPIGLFTAIGFLHLNQKLQDRKLRNAFTLLTISSMLLYLFQSLANLT